MARSILVVRVVSTDEAYVWGPREKLYRGLHGSFILQVACTFTDSQMRKQTKLDHAETLQPCL